MTDANDGAFAAIASFDVGQPSLTKREHFAAMAMQGLFSNGEITNGTAAEELVAEAVQMADALIAALNIPVCPDCKRSNADNHYDAEHNICSTYEMARSEILK